MGDTRELRQDGVAEESLCIDVDYFNIEGDEFVHSPAAARFCRSHQVGHGGRENGGFCSQSYLGIFIAMLV
jgi:hypothetical protein